MSKQILIDIKGKNLSEVAHYLVIYFPYNEKMCSYTDAWMGELYENKYPLVSKGMWSGIVDLKTHKLLNWKPEYGDLYLQAKTCDSETYILLDKATKTSSFCHNQIYQIQEKYQLDSGFFEYSETIQFMRNCKDLFYKKEDEEDNSI